MELSVYKAKFILLYEKLLDENFHLNSYDAENLIRYMESCSERDTNKLLEAPFFSELLLIAIVKSTNRTDSIKIFLVDIMTLVMKNELQFSKLLHMEGFHILAQGYSIINDDASLPQSRLAYIKQATVQLQHTSGLYWIIEQDIWQQIFNSCFKNQPSYILKASYKFLSMLLVRLNELGDEANLILTLEAIIKPIMKSEYRSVEYLTSDIEKTMIAEVKPSIMTLIAFLNTGDIAKVNKAVHLLARYFLIEAHLFIFVENTRDPEFATLSSELYFLFAVITSATFGLRTSNELPDNDISMEGVVYFNILHSLIKRCMLPVIIDFSIKAVLFWSKFGKIAGPPTFQQNGRTFVIDMQLVIILLVPFMCYTDTIITILEENTKLEENFSNYILKLTKITTEQIVKACYVFKKLVEERDKREAVIITARQITRLKGQLTTEQAGTIFQALFYVLRKHVPTDDSGALILTETKLTSLEDIKLLSLVLDVIKMILDEHDIDWYDNCEVVCLYNLIMNLLKPKTLPSKLVMQALDLIHITVKKFLSPDLKLLVESKSGSVLSEIGDIILLCAVDEEWEVRDSAMHLLLTCTELSFVKYIPFQKLISDNNLILEAARAACYDSEFYVQAIALRCLAAASKLQRIWRTMLCTYPKLYVKLIQIIQQHPEGIVRKEAVATLAAVFTNHKLIPECNDVLYKVMYNAALHDPHWEVQLAALDYWRKVIESSLSNRGMIDGKFPLVTFSKEKRKIVTLNEEEIKRQLIIVINELALVGCLSVLTNCINEYNNIIVIEKAYGIAKDFFDILQQYKLDRVPETSICTVVNVDFDNSLINFPPVLDRAVKNNQDEVIESILNTSQTELIETLCDNNLEIENEEIVDDIVYYDFHIMNPNEFLDGIINYNYLEMIEGKKKWNSGLQDLHCLLDDIISYEVVNSNRDEE